MTSRAAAWLLGGALACLSPAGFGEETFADGMIAYQAAVDSGKTDDPHYVEAARIWAPLAEAGDSAALYHMGVMEMFGLGGISFDRIKGFKKIKAAAEDGYPLAQALLGNLAERGDGVYTVVNDDVALDWYRKAADGGSCTAIRRLSQAYAKGDLGLDADEGRSKAWAERLPECRKF